MAASWTPPYCTRQQAQKTDTRIDAMSTTPEIDTGRSGGRKIRDSRRDGTHTEAAARKDVHPFPATVHAGVSESQIGREAGIKPGPLLCG